MSRQGMVLGRTRAGAPPNAVFVVRGIPMAVNLEVLVEAAGVELVLLIENREVIDSLWTHKTLNTPIGRIVARVLHTETSDSDS